MTGGAVLAVDTLRREYAGLLAFSADALMVDAGETVALLGPNGAGKSTFLKLAAGLLDPTEGTVAVAGAPAGSLDARAATSYLPDSPVLYADLSLWEQLEFVAQLHAADSWEERADDLLERLGLDERADDLPSTFSRGMRQKASIALAFIRPFSLLLADEPFDALDPESREVLADLMTASVADGASVVVSTHRLDFLSRASREIRLHDGSVVYDGPPEGGGG